VFPTLGSANPSGDYGARPPVFPFWSQRRGIIARCHGNQTSATADRAGALLDAGLFAHVRMRVRSRALSENRHLLIGLPLASLLRGMTPKHDRLCCGRCGLQS